MMAGIRGRNTSPEISLRKALYALGYRYRLHGAKLPGRPDIVLPKHRVVCFVHGCFWHQHPGCRFATSPKTRPAFWQAKFADNAERDRRNVVALLEQGWRVAVIWECALKAAGALEVASAVADWLKSAEPTLELAG